MNIFHKLYSFFNVYYYLYFKIHKRRGMLFSIAFGALIVALIEFVTDTNKFSFSGTIAIGYLFFDTFSLAVEHFKPKRLRQYADRGATDILRRMQPSNDEKADGFHLAHDSKIPNSEVFYSRNFSLYLSSQEGESDLIVRRSKNHEKALKHYLTRNFEEFSEIIKFQLHESLSKPNGSYFFNEDKVGICSTLKIGSREILVLKTHYFASIFTNDIACKIYELFIDGSAIPFFRGLGNYPVYMSKILNYGESMKQTNHIGVSTLAFTSDNMMVLWRQSDTALQSNLKMAPTGSGSMRWSDVSENSPLVDSIKYAANRELKEESFFRKNTQNVIERTLVIGYFRYLRRGGKPDFVCITKLKCSHGALEADRKEVEDASSMTEHLGEGYVSFYRYESASDLLHTVEIMLDNPNIKEKMSVPLWVNLFALKDYLKERPAQFESSFLTL